MTLGATGWFVLPQFLGQLKNASALVGGLQAKEQLAMTGVPAVARVVQAAQTGTMVNHNPQVWFQLEVQGPQGVYAAQTTAVVPQLNLSQCQPGMSLHVRVNPQNPNEIAVVF